MQNRIQITTNDVITPMPMTAHVGRPDSSLIIFYKDDADSKTELKF